MQYASGAPSILTYKRFHFDKLFAEEPYVLDDVAIYQVGDIFTKSGYRVPEHSQVCHELTLVISGEGVHTVNGHPYPMKRGDVLLAAKGTTHSSVADQLNPFRFFYIGFDFVKAFETRQPYRAVQSMLGNHVNLFRDDNLFLEGCMKGIFVELLELNTNSGLMIESYIRQIMIHLERLRGGDGQLHTVSHEDRAAGHSAVYAVIQYLDEHCCDLPNLSHIAREMGYSASYLSHLFSRTVGMTMRDYADQRRFERAVKLLASSDKTITEIAYQLNYKSVHAFSKAFKERFGLNPTEYQAIHQTRLK